MTTPAPPRKAAVPKVVWDLIFTLLIPILILSPNILGSGVSVAGLFGGGTGGNVRAYLLAALVPVAYVAWDLLRNRTLSPVAIMGGAAALISGALAFWYVDGLAYAFKDSARPFLFAAVSLVSIFTRYPLFRIFLDAAGLAESPEHRTVTQQVTREPSVARALIPATLIFGVFDLVGGVVNTVVNYRIVVAKFGSDSFNAQVAQANAVMRVPGLVLGLLGAVLGYLIVQRAVTARYGKGANLFEPAGLAERMKEQGA
jgi:hypothetical protein